MDIRFESALAAYEGRTALHPLTLSLHEPRIGVIGLNGSGKSTFARMINGLVKPSAGRVIVNGLDVVADQKAVLRQVGFIFQNPQNQIILPIIKDDIAFGLKSRKLGKAEEAAVVSAMLERLGIGHLAGRRAHELSGGELQLAALSAVLVTQPNIVILDEPTNQLDLKNRAVVESALEKLDENLIVISHDLDLVAGFDRVLLFHEGRLAGDGAPAEIIARYREMASR